MARVLVIEDEAVLRESIVETITASGHEVHEADGLRGAARLAQAHDFDLILTDVMLGNDDGTTFLKAQRDEGFDGVIVVMTAYASVESAVHAMKLGADDYLQKPLSLDELDLQIARWLDHRTMARRLQLYERMEKTKDRPRVLGSSPKWAEALKMAERFAGAMRLDVAGATETGGLPSILLLGETGCGKGVMARHIHDAVVELERHAERGGTMPPFVHVNCASLPSSLVEAELFGHEKGAFTDARDARPGLFEMADGGTIFLDEIAEMPLELQAKILLAVEQGTFRRVGGTRERKVNARIIAATHQLTDKLVAENRLRKDLYYRLSKFTVHIPALRERGDDRLLIASSALDAIAQQLGHPKMVFSASAKAAIERHPWPGNVRELINSVQRAAVICDGSQVKATDLGIAEQEPGAAASGGGELSFDFVNGSYTIEAVEKKLISEALRFTHGNVSKAARLLGLQRSSLRHRIERLGLGEDVPEVSRR